MMGAFFAIRHGGRSCRGLHMRSKFQSEYPPGGGEPWIDEYRMSVQHFSQAKLEQNTVIDFVANFIDKYQFMAILHSQILGGSKFKKENAQSLWPY